MMKFHLHRTFWNVQFRFKYVCTKHAAPPRSIQITPPGAAPDNIHVLCGVTKKFILTSRQDVHIKLDKILQADRFQS